MDVVPDLALFMSFLQGAGGRPREADGGLSRDVASIAAGHWRRGQPGAHLVGWEKPNQAQVHELARSQRRQRGQCDRKARGSLVY